MERNKVTKPMDTKDVFKKTESGIKTEETKEDVENVIVLYQACLRLNSYY